MEELTAAQRARYMRHTLVPEIGVDGQRRLLNASVLVVGAGGLGSAAIAYLAAAGVGRLGIVDDDDVALSNLQRQIIHTTRDVDRPKVASAAERVAALNPDVHVVAHAVRLTAANVWDVIDGYEVVVDGTDNFATRYLLSDACAVAGVPDVWAAVHRFDAAVSVFWRGHGPCYRCLHPIPPAPGSVPSCAEAGVLGALPGVVGAMQAVEAIKLLLGIGRPLAGRLASYDGLDATWRTIDVAPSPACAVCGSTPSIRTRADVAEAQASLTPSCAAQSPATKAAPAPEPLDAPAAIAAVAGGAVLLDVRSRAEADAWSIPGSLLIPVDELVGRLDEVPTGRDVVVYCAAGPRSARAAELLGASGRPARWIPGGIGAWYEALAGPVNPR